jgi:tetratricopeptide (TPR) repeat protein
VLQELGDLEGAKALYERALAIGDRVLDPDHLNIAVYAGNLGRNLQELGDLEGAKAQVERALWTFRQFLGEEHPYTVRAIRDLEGIVYLLAKRASIGE